MLLAIDIGNSNIVLGVFAQNELVQNFRLSTHPHRTADEYGLLCSRLLEKRDIRPNTLRAIVIASVVPDLDKIFTQACKDYFFKKPLFVGKDIPFPMPILVDHPKEVGVDRLLNAYAAFHKHACLLIVIDFGTGTTFDVVNGEGAFIGGAIAPGLHTSAQALFARASKLKAVELVKPPSVIGKNTTEAIQSGTFLGYAGGVDALVMRMKEELGSHAKVVATGGLAPLLKSASLTIDVVDVDLTLSGISLIYEKFCNGAYA